MLTACLAILCVLLMLVLLVQRPAIWPVLVVLAAAWCIGMGLFRYRLRSQLARWVCGGDFTKSKTKFSLEPLSQPVVLLSGETVLWYNDQFRQRMLGGQDLLVSRVQKVIPGPGSTAGPHPGGPAADPGRWRVVCPQLHRARRCGNDDAGGLQ